MMKSSRNLVGLFAFVAVAALAVAGCAHHDRNANYIEDQPGGAFGEVVAQRASFDLSCPSDKIQIQGIGGDSFGASGCERKASYTCVCMWHVWSTCTKPVCALDGISAPAAAANANAKTSEPAITYSAPPTAK